MISAEQRYEKKQVNVLGKTMSYVEEGSGDPIVFLHGNPTSSYLWRNVIPHVVSAGYRAIAPDLIGMGDSGKPTIGYTFGDHAAYLDAFIASAELTDLSLVVHDWGSGLGMRYARLNPDNVRALAFMEAIMYLMQERQIKNKRFGSLYSRLPSLETLDTINHYSLMYGFPFLTIGMVTGAIYAQTVLGSYWQWDPKEVWSLITWLFYAALLHARVAMGWRGRRAAIMSIIAFLILIFSFIGASLWLSDYHSFKNLEGGTGV
jgi:pimeloyl-ACP methyl ester carboxylesterase